jgi:hypothetical protein
MYICASSSVSSLAMDLKGLGLGITSTGIKGNVNSSGVTEVCSIYV